MLVRRVESIRLESGRGKRTSKKIVNVIKIDVIILNITKTTDIALNKDQWRNNIQVAIPKQFVQTQLDDNNDGYDDDKVMNVK